MHIKILGLNYKVKFVESDEIDGFYGEIIHKKEVIRMNKEHSLQRQKETLLHEIAHGIEAELKLGLKEETITRFTNVWYQVIVDNPDIFQYEIPKNKEGE